MNEYKKIHSNETALNGHLRNIKARGGIATTKQVKGGTEISYYFPEKPKSAKSKKAKDNSKPTAKKPGKASVVKEKKLYDVISPDGFSIRIGVPPFSSVEERQTYFNNWVKRFERQGYYSSVDYGRIPLSELKSYCKWIEL